MRTMAAWVRRFGAAAVAGALWAACLCAISVEAPPGTFVRQLRRVLATKIAAEPLRKGASVYTDREGTVETLPAELDGCTLIAGTSELRWAKLEGLCFAIEQPSVVYVGYHENIKNPPEWLTKHFEKTPMKIGVYEAGTRYPARPERRWNFNVWKRSYQAGPVILGGNKNASLPYITLVGKGVAPWNPHYGGPMPDAATGVVKEGGCAYPDRAYILKDVPMELAGAELLPMKQAYALEDGRYSGTHLRVAWVDTGGRELYPARDVAVFIAYDAGSPAVPEWMSQAGFKKTGLSLKVGNMKVWDDRPMAVYSARFKAGERVPLGPNRGAGCSGWPLQYLVMLRADEEAKR